jgi:signal transduction histidine kinase
MRGNLLGALTVASLAPRRRFDPADLDMVETLARRMATATDNAGLYEEAESAIRARDAFLSIASHELKTPLTTLMGYTTLLQRRGERGESTLGERDRRAIQVINEQAGRLNKMIGSLLDLSRSSRPRRARRRT